MIKNPYVIKSNWDTSHGDLSNSVCIDFMKEEDDSLTVESPNLDDVISLESAVQLMKPSQPSTNSCQENRYCCLNIKIRPGLSLRFITLVTDCAKIEIFTGTEEEYLKTKYGNLIDEVEGIKTYLYEMEFIRSIDSLNLKFITEQTNVWVYGVYMMVKDAVLPIYSPIINVEHVHEMLINSNQALTENASKCKEFIESYLRSKTRQQQAVGADVEKLLTLINANIESKLNINSMVSNQQLGDASQSSDATNAVHSGTDTTKPDSQNNHINVQSNEANQNITNGNELNGGTLFMMQSVIDEKLAAMENRIVTKLSNYMDMKLDSHLKKFDEILQLLKSNANHNVTDS